MKTTKKSSRDTRSVQAWTMVGGNGREIVRGNGRGKFWFGDGGLPMCRMPGTSYTEVHRARLAKGATEQTGTVCRWVLDGEAEVIPCL
jgi:hypothetical protein